MDNGGIQDPKHFGQSGHPSPAPAALTRLPTNIRNKVDPMVMIAVFWNEFSFT